MSRSRAIHGVLGQNVDKRRCVGCANEFTASRAVGRDLRVPAELVRVVIDELYVPAAPDRESALSSG